jgi:hypothetical protein
LTSEIVLDLRYVELCWESIVRHDSHPQSLHTIGHAHDRRYAVIPSGVWGSTSPANLCNKASAHARPSVIHEFTSYRYWGITSYRHNVAADTVTSPTQLNPNHVHFRGGFNISKERRCIAAALMPVLALTFIAFLPIGRYRCRSNVAPARPTGATGIVCRCAKLATGARST